MGGSILANESLKKRTSDALSEDGGCLAMRCFSGRAGVGGDLLVGEGEFYILGIIMHIVASRFFDVFFAESLLASKRHYHANPVRKGNALDTKKIADFPNEVAFISRK